MSCTWLGVPGVVGNGADGRHRLDLHIDMSMDMLFHSDGTAWFLDWNSHQVRRVRHDGTVETVVGWNHPVYPGDGVPGNEALEYSVEGAPGLEVRLNHPTDLVEDDSGQILLMAWHNHKLRRIDPDSGRVWIECGSRAGFAGDGLDAELALFKQPHKLARAGDGTLYIQDQQNYRIRRIDLDGIISTVAGSGVAGFAGDGGPALEASFRWDADSNPEPSGGIALAGDTLYVSDSLNHRIRAIDLETGIIETVAGTGEAGYSGDRGPALAARLASPQDLEIGPEGDLYFADNWNHAVRAIDLASGEIRTVAGTGEPGLDVFAPTDSGVLPAGETHFLRPWGIEFDPEGNLYVMDSLNNRIVKVMR